jgi:hypothetical protein
LQRGDYLQAFDQLYRSNDIYWFDAATVAERVLTVDELKHYVDTQVPAPPLTQQDRDNYVPLPVAAKLRNLLGRRLLREARYDEAPAYFDSLDLQNKAGMGSCATTLNQNGGRQACVCLLQRCNVARLGNGHPRLRDGAGLRHIGGNYSLESNELKVGPWWLKRKSASEPALPNPISVTTTVMSRMHWPAVPLIICLIPVRLLRLCCVRRRVEHRSG